MLKRLAEGVDGRKRLGEVGDERGRLGGIGDGREHCGRQGGLEMGPGGWSEAGAASKLTDIWFIYAFQTGDIAISSREEKLGCLQ